jgi:hypothetical protein
MDRKRLLVAAQLYRVIANKRLQEIQRQDTEIADLRREVAALRGRK